MVHFSHPFPFGVLWSGLICGTVQFPKIILNFTLFSKSNFNSLSSERILSIFDHATLKNYISAVIYSSISSYTSLERAKIKLSEKKYFGLRETIIFCTKKINKAYF